MNAEATTTETAATFADQGAIVAPESAPSKKGASQKKAAPKGQKGAKAAKSEAAAPKKTPGLPILLIGALTCSRYCRCNPLRESHLPTTEVQKAQRLAAMGMLLRHSGHSFEVGSGGTSPRRILAIRAFNGRMTKK
jgi:hypothetical protein